MNNINYLNQLDQLLQKAIIKEDHQNDNNSSQQNNDSLQDNVKYANVDKFEE